MPTYSYACTECGNRFDAVQAFSDDALTTCPECNGRLRKLFGNVGVVFKGSGFYRTDSRESAKSSARGRPTALLPARSPPAPRRRRSPSLDLKSDEFELELLDQLGARGGCIS